MTKTRDLADLGGGFIQEGTGAVQRTTESKLQDTVSAFDFMTEDEVSSVTTGTVNGVASFLDVTSALQAAINAAAGKQLILPPGIYHISSTLIIPIQSWLQGTGTSSLFPNFSTDWIGNRVPSWGYRATTIQYLNGHGTIFDNASDSRFDGLVIRNFLARNGTDLIFNSGTHFKFTNCVVQQMDGLLPNDPGLTSGACLIDACQFTACSRVVYGIFLDAKVLNSTFTSFTSEAFTISSGGGLNSFIGNRFDFCEGAAIRFLTNSRNNRVIGNNFDSHGGVALQFDQTSNRNIIANNHFWRCGRNESGDELDAFVKLLASSNQYFVGNLFIRGTPDIGSSWNGPEYVIGLESCLGKNYFVGNTIDKNSCYNKNPIRDKLGDSTNCIDIDSIFIGDDSGGDIGGTALNLGKWMAKPTVCYITENKTITGFSAGFENLTLTGASSGLTFTNSGGTLALDRTSKIDNITYGGRFYYTQNDQQYADGTPNDFRTQGNWPVNTLIYYQTPTTSLGAIKTANGSPDTWETFARNTAEALDDYEEGTWTPTVTPSTSGSITLNTALDTLAYTKVGRIVHIQGYVQATSVSSPVGFIVLSLPFSVGVDVEGQAASCVATWLRGTVAANANQFITETIGGSSNLRIYLGDATTEQVDSAQEVQANTVIRISGSYIAA